MRQAYYADALNLMAEIGTMLPDRDTEIVQQKANFTSEADQRFGLEFSRGVQIKHLAY